MTPPLNMLSCAMLSSNWNLYSKREEEMERTRVKIVVRLCCYQLAVACANIFIFEIVLVLGLSLVLTCSEV